jgi:hypothetical protein
MAGLGETYITKNIIFLVIITNEFYDWNYLKEGKVCSTQFAHPQLRDIDVNLSVPMQNIS